ncbi:MAG: restriction endonuclease subunit S [Candidatus Aenigmatarchaeota archaeon]|nr:MAG: restriction endonuclease subunit S [Candidatus Aenigmarchaeota archaeon]
MTFRLPEDWKKVRLGTLMRLVRRRFEPNKDDIRPYVGLEHILPEKLRLATHGWSYEVESTKFEFKRGDILFGKLRPYFRKVIYAKFDGICSTDIWVIRPNKGVDGRFLFYRLASWEVVNVASKASSGTKMPRAQWDFLVNYEVPIPPLSEQKKIAEILGSLDDKIELNYEMNKTLETIAQAIFKHWFIDFGPFQDDLVYNEELDKEIPEGWEVAELGEILSLEYGKGLPKRERKPGNIPVYGSSGIVGWHNKALVKGPGIIVGRKGTAGSVIWSHTDFFPIDTTFYAVPRRINSMVFLYFELKRQNLPKLVADSAVPGLNRNIAYMNKTIIPPESLVKRFDDLATPLFKMMHVNSQEIRVLEQIRDSLLPKLLSGEIRVKVDVEEEFPKETKKLVEIKKEKARIRKTLLDYFEGA